MGDRPVHVLFLDDDLTELSVLNKVFLKEPYFSAFAKDPVGAVAILAKEPVKVLISDQSMPAITGVEFLKRVKVNYPDIIRILLTGDADLKVAREAVNVGEVYRFLTKPYDQDSLRATVRQAVELFDSAMERRELLKTVQRKNEELRMINMTVQGFYEKQREFTSTVSHELRTPLAAIKMALDIIISGTTGPLTEDQRGFLNKAKTNVDRLHRLINNVLDLTKMESGKIALKIKSGDILALVEETVDSQCLVAKAKGLSLTVKKEGVIPLIAFDRDRIVQVLINLLSNAIKFTESGGITVVVSAPEGQNIVDIRVVDTGPGISSEDIGRLFEKFEQLEGDFNNKPGGTGLGLAICKSIVEWHGGKIWAESVLGKGTTLRFVLPIEERRNGRGL
ncbi:MAG: HAMP domain-containing histidine kinase [Candidatus Omnitrophica bacterium]|nr:HAMP domain-containing histidine kinase [Candidatus Omnitrophota bacterium]